MTRATSVLSVLSLAAAVFSYSVTHWAFPPVGFESILVYGALAIWLSAVSGVVTTLLCIVMFWRTRVRLNWPFLCVAAAGLVLFVTVRFPS